MRLREFSSLLVFVVIFALLSSGSSVFSEEEKEIKVKSTLESMTCLTKQIMEDDGKLAEYFKNKEFEKMAKLLGERHATIIVEPEYKRFYGNESAGFWEKVWLKEVKLKFKPVNIHISYVPKEVLEKEIEEKGKDAVNWYATVVQKFHIIHMKEGKVQKNISGTTQSSYGHRLECRF